MDLKLKCEVRELYIKEAVVWRVKQLCEERGISLNQLATLSGMTPSTLYSMVS